MPLPRVFISTDLRLTSEEKDDAQSLIHALLYQDRMNIVGIAGTASRWGHQNGVVGDIDKILDVYAKDHAKLKARSPAFKSAAELKALSWQGATAVAPSAGYSRPTDSSRAIIAEAKKAAAAGEKLNVLTWGGETDLAQALRDDPSIAPHVRFFNISNQDPYAYSYIKANFKGKFDMWVDNQSTYRGMYQTPASNSIIKGWHEVHAKGHGALGDYFAQLSGDIFNVSGVKMGDSPTVLRFLSGNQNDPTQESWGGEFIKVSDRYYTDNPSASVDLDRPNTAGAGTIYEDRDAWLSSFAERFDWIKDSGTTPVTTGPDTITVRVCGSALNGDPNFALTLDGRVIDSTNLVSADQAEGEWEVFTFRGTFVTPGVTAYRVGVQFTNDAYQAGVGDRNLWVDQVSLNGVVNTADQALRSNGTATWDIQLGELVTPPGPTTTNLLANGSFEAATVASGQYGAFPSMTGWTALAGSQIEIWNAHKGITATNGAVFAELDYLSALDGFYQDVQTVAGQAYTLSFDLCARPNQAISTQSVEVLWNGRVVASAVPTPAWRTFTVGVTGTGARDRLTIREVGSQSTDGWGALLDNFRLAPAGTAPSSAVLAEAVEAPDLGASLA